MCVCGLPDSPLADTGGCLVVLGHTHLVAATLDLQTGVFGRVKGCRLQSNTDNIETIICVSSCVTEIKLLLKAYRESPVAKVSQAISNKETTNDRPNAPVSVLGVSVPF